MAELPIIDVYKRQGLTMRVEGDANDYFGKGLSGGKLIIHPSSNAQFVAQDNDRYCRCTQ